MYQELLRWGIAGACALPWIAFAVYCLIDKGKEDE